nr:ribosomal protein S4 [Thismia javanica]
MNSILKKKLNVYQTTKITWLKKKLIYSFFKKNISKQIYNICFIEKYYYFYLKKNMCKFIVMRLDNIIFKINLCSVIFRVRQLINHKYILINGHFLNKPSYFCNFGDLIIIKKINCENRI